MLRPIWSDSVVLPVPWAPPMSISSPARMPPPSVRSSGEKPSGTGWYSATAPWLTFSDSPVSTSIALLGRSVLPSPSAFQSVIGASPVKGAAGAANASPRSAGGTYASAGGTYASALAAGIVPAPTTGAAKAPKSVRRSVSGGCATSSVRGGLMGYGSAGCQSLDTSPRLPAVGACRHQPNLLPPPLPVVRDGLSRLPVALAKRDGQSCVSDSFCQ